jgi:hypothetical protein
MLKKIQIENKININENNELNQENHCIFLNYLKLNDKTFYSIIGQAILHNN